MTSLILTTFLIYIPLSESKQVDYTYKDGTKGTVICYRVKEVYNNKIPDKLSIHFFCNHKITKLIIQSDNRAVHLQNSQLFGDTWFIDDLRIKSKNNIYVYIYPENNQLINIRAYIRRY